MSSEYPNPAVSPSDGTPYHILKVNVFVSGVVASRLGFPVGGEDTVHSAYLCYEEGCVLVKIHFFGRAVPDEHYVAFAAPRGDDAVSVQYLRVLKDSPRISGTKEFAAERAPPHLLIVFPDNAYRQ